MLYVLCVCCDWCISECLDCLAYCALSPFFNSAHGMKCSKIVKCFGIQVYISNMYVLAACHSVMKPVLLFHFNLSSELRIFAQFCWHATCRTRSQFSQFFSMPPFCCCDLLLLPLSLCRRAEQLQLSLTVGSTLSLTPSPLPLTSLPLSADAGGTCVAARSWSHSTLCCRSS